MIKITTYGFDPALNHGGLLQATFGFQESDWDSVPQVSLESYLPVFSWTKSDKISLTSKSDVSKIEGLVNSITTRLVSMNASLGPIGCDWDAYSVYWKSTGLQAVTMAFFMGYFKRAVAGFGFPVIFIKPSAVRAKLGLKANASKAEVQEVLSQIMIIDGDVASWFFNNEDYCDALFLAYVVACAKYQEVKNAQDIASNS